MNNVSNKAANIRLVVFDVDGVLTDGRLILGSGGDEYKNFHVHDGLGLVMLRQAGLRVGVISARQSDIVSERMAALEIEFVCQGQDDKRKTLQGLMRDTGVDTAGTAFVGDDLLDLPAMAEAGMAIAVADAHALVRERADWVTEHRGGRGAVREVCEYILRAQDKLEDLYRPYLK